MRQRTVEMNDCFQQNSAYRFGRIKIKIEAFHFTDERCKISYNEREVRQYEKIA